MGANLTAFCKSQDQLGSEVKMNYRGTPKFGTILGGCLSLTVYIFLAIYVGYTIYDWYKHPIYT